MKLFKRDKPVNHAVINTDDHRVYVLIKHRFTGFAVYDNYSLYEYNAAKEQMSDLPVARIQAHRTPRRFKPYVYSSMALISWAIARGKISLDKDTKIDEAALNSLFSGWLDEFNKGQLDILTIAAP